MMPRAALCAIYREPLQQTACHNVEGTKLEENWCKYSELKAEGLRLTPERGHTFRRVTNFGSPGMTIFVNATAASTF